MLEKFAEDDRIEQMNAQKRRMRQLEHKRAVEKLIEERREQFQRERVRDQISIPFFEFVQTYCLRANTRCYVDNILACLMQSCS